jgi:hypothetical protein
VGLGLDYLRSGHIPLGVRVRCGIQNARSGIVAQSPPSHARLPQDSNQNFRDLVALSRLVDPRSTLENLARNTALTYEDVFHHALVRYASSGAEALLAWEPQALRNLIAARRAEDWSKVGAIIDWLEAGLDSQDWH